MYITPKPINLFQVWGL